MQVNCSGKAQRGGLIRQWTAPARQPACTTGASIKHRSSRCSRVPAAPCSSACSLAETRLGAPRRRFPEAAQANVRNCPVVAADRVPESGRNTSVAPDNVVQQYPSGQHTFPTPPPKAMAHQADFPCALSAVPTANLSRLRSFRSVLNPVPPSQTSPWATASMPTSTTNGFGCLPRKPRLSSQRSSVAFSNARRGFAYSRCCDHEFDPVGP